MKNRLKEFLEFHGLSARQFADKIEIQPSSISHVLTGRNKPSVDMLEKMIRVFPEMDISYLISGIKSNEKKPQLHDGFEQSDVELRTEANQNTNDIKKTRRIVLFNDDGTFEEYFST